MTRKEEKELYTITGNEKKEESFIKWSLISLAVCLTITFGVLIYGKFAGENATWYRISIYDKFRPIWYWLDF